MPGPSCGLFPITTGSCASVKIPVVAIGGICLDNIEKLQGSGAAGAAIVSGIFAAEDIEGTTRALRQKMERII